jgi:glutamyl-tRNA synthetase
MKEKVKNKPKPNNQELLAQMLFPEPLRRLDEFEHIYPKRELPDGAMVTRFAPSPTGFPHIGSVYAALICSQLAFQTNGVSIIRIEDTDEKREVEGGKEQILSIVDSFNISFDERPIDLESSRGKYGPYIQSKRKEIYLAGAKELVLRHLAYPCFCSEDELDEMRKRQEKAGVMLGYYGEWTRCRNLTISEIEKHIQSGDKYVIRFRSPNKPGRRTFNDIIKGPLEFPENVQDIVLIKSGLGLPTYHLAHVIDDHFMRTTHVIRGDEWLSSLPVHLQLFEAFGWKVPEYAHFAPILKQEGNSKRKLSKRKDPEASATFYLEEGIPEISIKSFLIRLVNSDFEDWRRKNPQRPISDFRISLRKMSATQGAILDLDKLKSMSRDEIARMNAEEIYIQALKWAERFNRNFYDVISANKDYFIQILNIERNGENPRKDLSKWSELPDLTGYFFDDIYAKKEIVIATENIPASDTETAKSVLEQYLNNVEGKYISKDDWLERMKELCSNMGYAISKKDFNKNVHKAHIGDVAMVLRIALTGKTTTPDLYEIIKVMGNDRVKSRLLSVLTKLNADQMSAAYHSTMKS